MTENLRLSLQGIWHHRMRSALTMLGIIIGIASIIAIVSTIKGNSEMIKQSLIGANTNVVDVLLYEGKNPFEFGYTSNPQGLVQMGTAEREKIEAADGVSMVSFYNKREYTDGTIYYKNTSYSGAIYGVDDQYLDVYGYGISSGRAFSQADFDNFSKVAILTQDASTALFAGEDPIGKILEIKGDPFIVIGIAEQEEKGNVSIKNINDYYIYGEAEGGKIFFPDTVWPVVYNFDEIQNIAVRAEDTDSMAKAGSNAANVINEELGLSKDTKYIFRSKDVSETAQKLETEQNSTNQMLIWIAGISLLVGGIGVMNIMLVTVTERTKEIGLKKAIGAKQKQILAQFLTEAAVLTGCGGLIGVVAGIIVAKIISYFTSLPTAISIPAILVAVVFSFVIGLVFGYLPARKAALLNPIDALRSE